MVKIAIDAGHGFNTPGKRSPIGEREWTFNDKVARAAINELNKYKGVQILRLDDPSGKTDVPLITRTNKANKFGADILVSIHHNANTSKWGSWGGVETFVQEKIGGPKSNKLAKLVHSRIVKAMGLRDRGVKTNNLHMTRESYMPAILTEGGFMDSTTDIGALRDDSKLKAQGVAIANGIVEYFGLTKDNSKPSKPTETKPSKPSNESKIGTVEVLVDSLNIRKSNSFSSSVVKVANKGQKYDVYNLSNGLYKIKDGQWISAGSKYVKFSKVNKSVHKVAKGETLWSISQKYKTSVNELKKLNNLKSDVINVGKLIKYK